MCLQLLYTLIQWENSYNMCLTFSVNRPYWSRCSSVCLCVSVYVCMRHRKTPSSEGCWDLVKSRPPNICLQWHSLVLCFCFINLDKIFFGQQIVLAKMCFCQQQKMLTKNVSKIKGLAKKKIALTNIFDFFLVNKTMLAKKIEATKFTKKKW